MKRLIALFISLLVASISWNSLGCGGGETVVTVTAQLIRPDGTVLALSDSPLPLNLTIRLTFSDPVVPTEVRQYFVFTDDRGFSVPSNITWNAENTVMSVKPHNRLNTDTTYGIGIMEFTLSSSTSTSVAKARIDQFAEVFTTMVDNDINGDGLADLTVPATGWEGGTALANSGRGYLFYGTNLATKSAADADARIAGESAGDQVNFRWAQDINDDGYADLMGFSILYETVRGAFYIFYGGAGTPIAGDLSAADADLKLNGSQDGEAFFLPRGGDVNGDGFTDLVVGASGYDSFRGRVSVFFGPNFENGDSDSADVQFDGEAAGDILQALSQPGDVNGDGIADILCYAQGWKSGGGGGGPGRIYVIYGGSDLTSGSVATADVIIDGEADGDRLEVRGFADFDGDGIEDIFGEARGYESNRGRAYVFYGANLATKTNASEADVIFTGEADAADFGFIVRAAELTGDMRRDFIVSTAQYQAAAEAEPNRGRIYIFAGGDGFVTKGAENADIILTGEFSDDRFGFAGAGDVNGDFIDDIAANASAYQGGANTGRAYFFYGGTGLSTRVADTADVIFDAENASNDQLGIRDFWDFNGDGVMDIFLNASGFDDSGTVVPAATGRAYIFYGGSDLLSQSVSAAPVIITGENGGDLF